MTAERGAVTTPPSAPWSGYRDSVPESLRSESLPCPDCGEPMVIASRGGDEQQGDNEFVCENEACPAKQSRPRD